MKLSKLSFLATNWPFVTCGNREIQDNMVGFIIVHALAHDGHIH